MEEKKFTEWDPTLGVEKYGARKRKSYITDEGKKKRLPTLRYEEWCKPSGTLARIAIETTRDQKAPNRGAYTDAERRRQIAAGSFPWRYETAKLLTPVLVGALTEAQWLEHRERLLAERRTDHETRSVKIDGGERMVKAIEGNTDAIKRMVDATTSQIVRRQKQSGGE